MNVYFTPTPAMPSYRGSYKYVTAAGKKRSDVIVCEGAGEYDWPEAKVTQVCADFPANFSLKKGGSKSAGPPSKNRAASPPGKNR